MTDEKGRKPGLLILFLAVIVVFVLVGVIMLFPPNGGDNGNGDDLPEDKGPWKDLTKMKASISEVSIFNYYEVDGPEELEDELSPDDMVYMIIGVESNFTSEELVIIRDFAEDGGKVIIADDGTLSNRLHNFTVGAAGGKVNLLGHNYLVDRKSTDPVEMDPGWVKNIRFIKGYSFPIRGQVYHILADSPKGMEITGDPDIIATTTMELTTVDLNDDGAMGMYNGEFEPYVPFGPIGVRYKIGEKGGSITTFSTTGFLTDTMYGEASNEGFIRAYILSMLPEGGDVVLDDSKQIHSYSPHTLEIPD